MKCFIPSRGRAELMTTHEWIPEATVVVYPEELEAYQKALPVTTRIMSTSAGIDRDICSKRQWIMAQSNDDKIMMFDDDLVFAQRRADDPTKFYPATEESIKVMLETADMVMDSTAHGAIAPREGGNRITDQFMFNSRAMRALFWNKSMMRNVHIKGGVMCDFYTTLALLTRGIPNVVINGWVTNQAGSDTTGGCSLYRTPAVQTEAAIALFRAFPKYVTLTWKETKESWGGGGRVDVRVQWQKAYEDNC